MTKGQKFQYSITNREGRTLAKFSLLSEAMTAADALAEAYREKLWVNEDKYEGYVHATIDYGNIAANIVIMTEV